MARRPIIQSPRKRLLLQSSVCPDSRCLSTADVYDGAPIEVRLGLPQDFMNDRGGVTQPWVYPK